MLTRMPLAISSWASVSASASSAALAMLYGAPLARMAASSVLEMAMMSPRGRSRIAGSSRWTSRWADSACVVTTRTSSAGSVSATECPREAMPALSTSRSIGPSCLERGVGERVDLVGHRALQRDRAVARERDHLGRVLGAAAVVDADARAGRGQLERDPAPDARGWRR